MEITKVELEGIYNPPAPENRVLLLIKVHYNDEIYNWQIYAPIDTGDWEGFLETNKERIKSQIDAKEAEWAALEPKTQTIENPMGEPIVVELQKSDVVKADIPDYYAKRRSEYPPIGDQLDAMWKGVDSPEFSAIMNKIQAVKDKYPKS